MRNVRYLYDNPLGEVSFDTAFQVEAGKGSGEQLVLPVETLAASAIVEIVNTLPESTRVDALLYSMSGELLDSISIELGGKNSFHWITDSKLGTNQRGLVIVESEKPNSIYAVSMHYLRGSAGEIMSMYGVAAKQALGPVLRTSYNTFLNQDSELVILNTSNQEESLQISMVRSDGTELNVASLQPGAKSEALNMMSSEHTVPANGQLVINLSEVEGPNNYGVVTVSATTPGKIVTWLLRRKGQEFVMPVPAR